MLGRRDLEKPPLRKFRGPAILCFAILVRAQTTTPDPAGLLNQFAIARFLGSGAQSIAAMTSDAAGNVYVAGSTSSTNFPVKNAAQPQIGEAVLMRSPDGGVTWQKVPIPTVSLVTITPHPSNPQTLFGGAADGIYESSDGGQAWRKVYAWTNPATDDQMYIAVDAANPQNVYFYAQFDVYDEFESMAQLFLASADGGESWIPLSAPSIGSYLLTGAPALWVDPNGSGTLALGSNLSRDHGNTWTAMSSLPPEATFGFIFTVAVPGHAGWIYAQGTGGGNLYLSKDWGNTWTMQPSPLAPSCTCPTVLEDLRFDPDLPGTFWADDLGGNLYTSGDAGATWSVVSAPSVAEGTPFALVSRKCSGGALVEITPGRNYGPMNGTITASHAFGANWLAQHLTNVVDVAAGPGCAVYAVKTPSTNAFVAKLSRFGEVLWSTFLGGSDLDTAAGVALDAQGNVYVAGSTASPDFPATSPRVGADGTSNAFAAEFDTNGNLLYSVAIGGESVDTVTGLAVNGNGEAHLAGWTVSNSFPTTPGAFAANPGQNNGFAVKLGHGGTIVYSSYLPGFAPLTWEPVEGATVAVGVEASGTALFGGPAGQLVRMSADGSSFTAVSTEPGAIYAIVADSEGNVYVAGQQGGSQSLSTEELLCDSGGGNPAFVVKLQPDTLNELYRASVGHCPTRPAALQISPDGEATLSFWTMSAPPLVNPLLVAPPCAGYWGEPALARLSADGATTLFASYLDTCSQAPAIAITPDGSAYASVNSSVASSGGGVAILRIPPAGPGPAITGAYNAFSGALATAASGMLLTITGTNLAPDSVAAGIEDPNPLPRTLGGIQVLFDGTPAEILQVTPESIICVVPEMPSGETFLNMEVVRQARVPQREELAASATEQSSRVEGHPIALPVQSNLGLMTAAFPALPPTGVAPGTVANADGSLNSAQSPAAPGSTVTLYATGVTQPGSIPLYWDPTPPVCFGAPFAGGFDCTYQQPAFGDARLAAGLIDGVYAVYFTVPSQAASGQHVISPQGVTQEITIYVR
jgi:uncharacterized protein (TIGR03437 family)